MFLGGLGPLTPKNNGWCCDRDEGGVNRVRGSVYRWLGAILHLLKANVLNFYLTLDLLQSYCSNLVSK